MTERLILLHGDAIGQLRTLPTNLVQTVVVSIPYWSLRDYGIAPLIWDDFVECEHEWESVGGDEGYTSKRKWQHSQNGRGDQQDGYDLIRRETNPEYWGQVDQGAFCLNCEAWRGSWGLEPTPQLYLQHTVQVFREMRRVVRKDGTVFLNLGDAYAGGRSGSTEGSTLQGTRRNVHESRKATQSILTGRQSLESRHVKAHMASTASYRRDKAYTGDMKHKSAPGLKLKDLMGLPWMVAFALRDDGWWLRSDIVWHKPNAMPESTKDRPTRAHEYVFLLSKSRRYFYDAIAIAEPVSPNTHTRIAQRTLDQQQGGPKGHESQQQAFRLGKHPRKTPEILKAMAKKAGVNPKAAHPDSGIRANESFAAATTGAVLLRNKRTVWSIPTRPFEGAHFATFPPDLVSPCILAGTSAVGACPKCGAPWVRLVEKEEVVAETAGEVETKYPAGDCNGHNGHGLAQLREAAREQGEEYADSVRTLGWRPTCKCIRKHFKKSGLEREAHTHEEWTKIADGLLPDFKPVPCVVMDICAGSGTTGMVALELGRCCILIEPGEQYLGMIDQRTSINLGLPLA